MPRVVRALYARPREQIDKPDGGLNLRRLVEEARQECKFERLFGQAADMAELVAKSVQRRGWTLARAEIVEALEDNA